MAFFDAPVVHVPFRFRADCDAVSGGWCPEDGQGRTGADEVVDGSLDHFLLTVGHCQRGLAVQIRVDGFCADDPEPR